MRVLTSTFFNMLSVVFIRFSCFSVTTFCLFVLSFISHLSSAHLSSFSSGLKIGHGGLFFHFFHFLWALHGCFCCEKRKEKKSNKWNFSLETSSQLRRTLTRSRARLLTHTHTHCIYLCNLQNPKSTLDQNARTSKKSLFVFLVCYKRVIHQYLLEERKHGDEESDAVGHGESRRRCPRWYPRNRHTEYVFTLVLIGG